MPGMYSVYAPSLSDSDFSELVNAIGGFTFMPPIAVAGQPRMIQVVLHPEQEFESLYPVYPKLKDCAVKRLTY